MIELAPIIFKPYLKTVIWGGSEIAALKGLPPTDDHIGESWEISAVPGFVSTVASGPYAGESLDWLVERFGAELLGEDVTAAYGNAFPLLVKIIDANADLSVQVHPDDELARKRHDSLGKTEMWYIMAARPGAKIYAGLRQPLTPEEYEKRVADGTFASCLAVHDSRPGDVFFLPAGMIHAIGAGNLLAEIQESSDITYRIYDYGRKDAQGKPRELHTELARDAIDYNACGQSQPAPCHSDKCELVRCGHFSCYRILVDGEQDLSFDPGSFTVIMCVEGKVSLESQTGRTELPAGHTALVPAALPELKAGGKATLLTAQCPAR